jgi:hypothetical protein
VRRLLKMLPNFITTPNRGAYLHAMLSLNPPRTSPARNRCHLPLSSSRSAHMGGTHTTLSLGLLPSLSPSLVNFFSCPTSSSRAHVATLRSPAATGLAAAPPGPGWIPGGSGPIKLRKPDPDGLEQNRVEPRRAPLGGSRRSWVAPAGPGKLLSLDPGSLTAQRRARQSSGAG